MMTGLVDPDFSIFTFHFSFLQSVSFDFLVQRGAVDIEQPGSLLPIPMAHLECVQNDFALGIVKRLLERLGVPWLRAAPISVLDHGSPPAV